MSVDLGEGFRTNRYIFIVYDYHQRELFRHELDHDGSLDLALDYINDKFVNNRRFANVKAVYKRISKVFVYTGIDKKRIVLALSEDTAVHSFDDISEPYSGQLPVELVRGQNVQDWFVQGRIE